ncbi:MAG: M23 family metallopeptidase [Bacteroidales bacterium]|jgi:murein DD-endopeptidase MepM/ murein hydrolase activator NlpD|nr:M23 family metallopeptidase [Bacteroidales bacterium]
MGKRNYFLDLNDLQYKQVKHPFWKKLLHSLFWIAGTLAITVLYITIFQKYFGSPKEHVLNQQIDNIKLEYSIANRKLDISMKALTSLKQSDEIRYRPIMKMDSIPWSIRNPGFGGVDRFRSLDGYINSYLMRSTLERIEEMKNMANVQNESFVTIRDKSEEWKFEMDHLPAISPVDPSFRLGDRYGFREVHPVLGYGRMHYGQDFEVPNGTKVYATGNGRVVESGRNGGGFGNYVVIDHGYGLVSIYAHLSEIKVPKDINVRRGDLIGLSGSTGTSSGPHLHYQINKYGSPVNAINFFNNDITQEEFREMIQAFGSDSMLR